MKKGTHRKTGEVKTPKLYLGKSGSDHLGNCAGMLSPFRDTTEQHHFSLASQEQSPGTPMEITCFWH